MTEYAGNGWNGQLPIRVDDGKLFGSSGRNGKSENRVKII
jgi:hypothetical protein